MVTSRKSRGRSGEPHELRLPNPMRTLTKKEHGPRTQQIDSADALFSPKSTFEREVIRNQHTDDRWRQRVCHAVQNLRRFERGSASFHFSGNLVSNEFGKKIRPCLARWRVLRENWPFCQEFPGTEADAGLTLVCRQQMIQPSLSSPHTPFSSCKVKARIS